MEGLPGVLLMSLQRRGQAIQTLLECHVEIGFASLQRVSDLCEAALLLFTLCSLWGEWLLWILCLEVRWQPCQQFGEQDLSLVEESVEHGTGETEGSLLAFDLEVFILS
jgi:hypothetical protein